MNDPLEAKWLDVVRRQVALEEVQKAEAEVMRHRHLQELIALVARQEQERVFAAARHASARLALWRTTAPANQVGEA